MYCIGMVKNSEMPELGDFAKRIAQVIKEDLDAAGISGSRLAGRLDRAQSYASNRINGRVAWTIDEIDIIADMLNVDALDLMRRAR